VEHGKYLNPSDYQRFLDESAEELYHNATCGYLSFLKDGLIVKLNKTLLDWLGYTQEEILLSKNFQALLPIGGKIYYETHLAPLLQIQSSFREISLDLFRWDGSTMPVLVNAIQIKDDTGRPVLNRLTLVNITDRRKYEQELLLAKKKAEFISEELAYTNTQLTAANQEILTGQEELLATNQNLAEVNRQLTRLNNDLDTFIYTASHDLKAPILNIEGLLKVLKRELGNEKPQPEKVQHIYAMLSDSVERFKLTIQHLTDVAQVNKSSQDEEVPILMSEVLFEVHKDLAPQITDTNAEIKLEPGSVEVRFSQKNLKSILYNLISNAIKYHSPKRKPVIHISMQEEIDYQVLTVKDNGLGIDMSKKEKMFALFQRLHSHVPGTGMGLFIVKKMVENAGGKIEVESQIDAGTTFKIYFQK
jgi:sigma-B regulation protein RsbU (phosphoserine phosphatase)